MKSDSNTEMDLLLRRHARRKSILATGAGDVTASCTEQTSTGPHMDADEMNSYAEGGVPVAARARYVAHLADCDQCRSIVTDLTLAANVHIEDEESARQQAAATTPQSSWREWLAALFAPPLIRYGATALALLCVGGVVFLAMRQQKSSLRQEEPTYVAQNKQVEEQPASAVKPATTQPSVTQATPVTPGVASSPALAKEGSAAQTGPTTDTVTESKTKSANVSQPAGATRADAPAEVAAPPANEPAPRQAANDQRDEDRLAGASPAKPLPATIAPSASAGRGQEQSEADKTNQNRKDNGTSNSPSSFGMTSNTATTNESEETAKLSRSTTATEARRRAARKTETMREGADTNSSTVGERSAETRKVGGRQFRREGGAWVDTAYSSGRATVNVSRGSEQYRALVADEPGLRTIADQLGGEVIVMWKGRAYRIH
jgi:hypothetical protein